MERVQASFGALESQNDELVQKVSLLEKELSERDSSRLDIESQLEQAHQELSTITGRLKQFDQARLEWSGEKQEMLEKLLEKDEQLHLTSDELNKVTAKLALLGDSSRQEDVQASIFELQSSERSLEYQVSKLEQELTLTSEQNEWLKSELKTKNDEFASYRVDRSSLVTRLQTELESCKSLLKSSENSHEQLQSRLQELQKLYMQNQSKLEIIMNESASNEENLKHELQLQKKLIEALKRGDGDKTAKLNELSQELADVEQSIALKVSEFGVQLDERDRVIDELNEIIGKQEGVVGELREKITMTDEFLLRHGADSSEPQSISKTASMLNQLKNSGKTFTEVYTDFVKSQNEVTRLTLENGQLRDSMRKIRDEVDYKTRDFEKLIISYEQVSKSNGEFAENV